MAMVPVSVLAAPSVSVPGPVLVRPWLPPITVLRVVVWLVTFTAGLPLATASVSVPPLPVLSVQSWLGVVSPNLKPPIVRDPSSVTMVLAARSSEAKLAVAAEPLATPLANQLPAVGHDPPLALVHTGLT